MTKHKLQRELDQLDLGVLLQLLFQEAIAASQQDQGKKNKDMHILPARIAKKLKKHMEAEEKDKVLEAEEVIKHMELEEGEEAAGKNTEEGYGGGGRRSNQTYGGGGGARNSRAYGGGGRRR